jgi:LacI family transcriptional regulator
VATARDVAKRAGVSTSTVSHVLNGTRGVSKALRQRVLDACEELAFEPNVVARSLKTSRSRTLGFVVPDVNEFFTQILLGVEEVAEASGYSVIFCHSHGDPREELAYLRLLRGRRVDGIILAPTGTRHADLERLVQAHYPLVLVDRVVRGLDIDLVSVDNEPAAYAAVSHLLKLGHRRVAMITGDMRMSSSEPRVRGYRRALEEAGVPFDPALLVSGEGRTNVGRLAVKELMSRETRPSALFVANNLMTIGAMMALQEMGISMPGDLAYVGFDDFDWAGFLRPQLTMIAQPTYEIGRTAAQLVIERIGQGGEKPARRIALGGRLMVRESSGALSAGRVGPAAGGGTAVLSDGAPLPSLPNGAPADATAPRRRRRTRRSNAAVQPEAKT